MKFKKYFIIVSLFIVLIASISVINAASNETTDNYVSEVNVEENYVSISNDDSAISDSQENGGSELSLSGDDNSVLDSQENDESELSKIDDDNATLDSQESAEIDDLSQSNEDNSALDLQESGEIKDYSSQSNNNVLTAQVSSQKNEKVLTAQASSQSANKVTKQKLKIITVSNFVKNKNRYCFYLTDSKGNVIPNKKLTITVNGKNYERTSDSSSKVGITLTSSKSYLTLKIKFKGDEKYYSFSQKIKVYILKSIPIAIGNSKILTNGFLRIYLRGTNKEIYKKTIKVKIGKKKFTVKTNYEGFVVIKPQLTVKKHKITVTYGKYKFSKKIKCIKGDVKDPFKTAIPTVKGVPDVDVMPSNYVMGDNNAKYTLKKGQYRHVIKRDGHCLYLYGKLSKYTFFKTKASPNVYHILKREKWNVIERAINTKLVKANSYEYWPNSITVSLKGKKYTYPEVRDVQNTGYTCGPAAASVCTQALRNYHSEKFFEVEAAVVNGVNVEDLQAALNRNGYSASLFYELGSALTKLSKGGCALVVYLPNHYVSAIDVSKDGKKVLVSNSYGKYNVGGATKVPTKWVSTSYFKSKFAGVGLVVKNKYTLTKSYKKQVSNFYSSMGTNWNRHNTNERLINVPL